MEDKYLNKFLENFSKNFEMIDEKFKVLTKKTDDQREDISVLKTEIRGLKETVNFLMKNNL